MFPDNRPDVANFFQKPEDLIFNPSCKLIPQIDHILEENKDRFPLHIQNLNDGERRMRLSGAIKRLKRRLKQITNLLYHSIMGIRYNFFCPCA